MDIGTIIGLSVGSLIALLPLAYVAYLDAGGIYHTLKRASAAKSAAGALSCSATTDCPPGYVCVDGRCVPEES